MSDLEVIRFEGVYHSYQLQLSIQIQRPSQYHSSGHQRRAEAGPKNRPNRELPAAASRACCAASAPAHVQYALSGVSLSISQGEHVAVAGVNGSGKSTLLRHINGLLLPARGKVTVFGLDSADRRTLREIRSAASMVFQNPDAQIVGSTVEEDVAFGPENLGVPVSEIRERVEWALGVTGLSQLRSRASHLLSAGQKQLLTVAGALAMRPRCILLDEAGSMLDPEARDRLNDLIGGLNREGVTVVRATHRMEEAARAGRVVVLRAGEIAADLHPRNLFSDDRLVASLGLELPRPVELGGRLHALFPDFPGVSLNDKELVRAVSERLSGADAPGPDRASEQVAAVPDRQQRQADPLVEIRGLHHTYMRGTGFDVHALRGVDFEAARGESVGLIGPSGSGKSTLLAHLNGLFRPQQGEVAIDGIRLGDLSVDVVSVRRKVGLVFQRPEAQLFERFAGDDVAFGPRKLGLGREEVRALVRRAMDRVGLRFEQYKDRLIAELSGGEKRRLALAGVLAMDPEVLIVDEPTAGIDPAGRRSIHDILRGWAGERTLILVSHDLEEIAALCDRVYVLAGGRVITRGTAAAVLSDKDLLREQGLGLPFTVRLFHELRAAGMPVREGLYTMDQAARALGGLMGAVRA